MTNLSCGEHIDETDHALRQFCEKWYDDSGKVHDCKTAFHRAADKPDREKHAILINNLKGITYRLDQLVL